jgi:xylose dehydrogenase (NAD/NADP)
MQKEMPMPSSDRVRWGILGPGGIAGRLLEDLDHASNFSVVAAGGRNLERSREFAKLHGIARAYGSYDELLADPEVDAVYIGLPNSLHHPWTMRALTAGKHVLCEKPYSRHPAQVIEAFDAAYQYGLFLMEAFMWRHSPQTRRFLELLPQVGEMQSIRAAFSFPMTATTDVRLDPNLDGGALMDVGCYAVSGSRLAAGTEPVRVYGEQVLGPTGVDIRFSGMLTFPSGVVSEIAAGFTSEARSLEVVGDKGTLLSRDPWQGQLGGLELNGRPEPVILDDHYRLEMENLSAAILGKGTMLLGRADALGQARAIDALYRSAESGVAISLKD